MKKLRLLLPILLLLGILASGPHRITAESEAVPAPKVIVVKYDADW